MTAVAIYAASQFGLLIGNPESPLRWILPGLDRGRGDRRGHRSGQPENPLTGVVRPDGSSPRYRARLGGVTPRLAYAVITAFKDRPVGAVAYVFHQSHQNGRRMPESIAESTCSIPSHSR